MKQIQLFVYPYWKIRGSSTELWADQKKMLPTDSRFAALLAGAGPAQWLRPYREGYSLWKGFLAELVEEFNDDEFHIRYCGRTCDFLEITGECRRQAEALKRNQIPVRLEWEFAKRWEAEDMAGRLENILSMVEKLGLARRKDLRWRTREELAYDRANQSFAGECRRRMQEFSLRYLGETPPAGWECAAPGWKFREGGGTPVILLDGKKDAWVLMEQLEFLNGSLKEKEWKDSVVFLLGEEQGAIQEKTQMLKDNLLQKYRMVPAMYGAADRNAFRTILCRHLADTVLAEKISENIRRITERITSFPGWEMDVDLVDIYRELEALQEI